jgi:hypothetical protein
VFILLELSSPSRRIFIGSHSLPPSLVRRIGPSVPDVQTFRKSYLPHPDTDFDVLHMNLDLVDEYYPIVMSKLPFEEFDQGGQIGFGAV